MIVMKSTTKFALWQFEHDSKLAEVLLKSKGSYKPFSNMVLPLEGRK